MQQLHYADEVRTAGSLNLAEVEVGSAELELAARLIAQGTRDHYDPDEFVDEAKQRVLAAVEAKVAGRKVVEPGEPRPRAATEVIDLLDALRASLAPTKDTGRSGRRPAQRAGAPAKAPQADRRDGAPRKTRGVAR